MVWIEQKGASPFQVDVSDLVAESNCVSERKGGEQLDAKHQSVTKVNSIRPSLSGSQLANDEPLPRDGDPFDSWSLPGG